MYMYVPDRAMRAIPSDGRPRCHLYDCATCAMMMMMMIRCSMRDGVSQTGRVKPADKQTEACRATEQNERTPALFACSALSSLLCSALYPSARLLPLSLFPRSLPRAAHVMAPRVMQPLQLEIHVSTDVLAPPTSRLSIKVTLKITLGTVLLIVRLCELSPASLTDQQKITRQSLPGHQEGPCSQHLASCHCSYSTQSDVFPADFRCYKPRHFLCLLLRLSLFLST
jgi:hypothetical protein